MCKNGKVNEETVQHLQVAASKVITNDVHRSRLVYNSRVKPKEVEALFAKRTGSTCLSTPCFPVVFGQVVRARVARTHNNAKIAKSVTNDQSAETISDPGSSHDIALNPSPYSSTLTTSKTLPIGEGSCNNISTVGEFGTSQVQGSNPSHTAAKMVAGMTDDDPIKNTTSKVQDPNPRPLTNPTAEVMSCPRGGDPLPSGYTSQSGLRQEASIAGNSLTAKVIPGERAESVHITQVGSEKGTSVNSDIVKGSQRCENSNQLILHVNYSGIEDKFVNSILHAKHAVDVNKVSNVNNDTFHKWRRQSAFNFGYIPLADQLMPGVDTMNDALDLTPIEMHYAVRKTNKPNFMLARIPVRGQLNVEAWCEHLGEYWDQQLLQLIRFGFPLDFNRACNITNESGNHKSAVDYPMDIDAYIAEEKQYDAIIGPFNENPIYGGHSSPFMTRAKPNSDRRRVIIDLSWPLGASVNAGIDKNAYLDAPFALTFPTVDNITDELKRLGRGAFLYKIDVSRAFRHVKVDPGDYDLLGLEWNGHYVDTCVPFGTRHGSQIFQRLSDAVRYVMRRKGFTIIDYIDDYVGVGVPSVAWASFHALLDLMTQLGLTVSVKKLVRPATQATCLGVLIDTEKGTISIPPEKLRDVTDAVRHWMTKDFATKRQLQSILGLLLYVHKCVKPARVFLNRMLEVLRSGHGRQKIHLTPDFKRDLGWFDKFLNVYNGVSLYDHRSIDVTLELDACLTGFGGRSGNYVYHLPIIRGFRNLTIVHLEMVNILLAIRTFKPHWASKKILIQCDNEAVVTVLRSGKTRDPYLAACARNIWYTAAAADIDLQYVHIRGVDNRIADVLSRWQGTTDHLNLLYHHIQKPIWLHVVQDMLDLDPEL